MNVVSEILEALEQRQADLNNLERTLDTLIKLDENLTAIIIVQEAELKTLKNETDRQSKTTTH
jgi:hypothetical protein